MGPRLFRRGNYVACVLFRHTAMFASMGPRLFRRGNSIISGCVVLSTTASMGPRLFRRGNAGCRRNNRRTIKQLQWGHVFSDVETNNCVSCPTLNCPASMGPRLFRRGNADNQL